MTLCEKRNINIQTLPYKKPKIKKRRENLNKNFSGKNGGGGANLIILFSF